MIRFACPQCHKLLQVDDNAAGKRLKCPQCNGVLVVPANRPGSTAAMPKATPLGKAVPPANAAAAAGKPAPKQPAAVSPAALFDLPLDPFALPLDPLPPIVRRRRRSLLLPLVVGGVVLVAAAVGLTLLVTGHGSQPNTNVPNQRADAVEQDDAPASNSHHGPMARTSAHAAPSVGAVPGPAVPAAPALQENGGLAAQVTGALQPSSTSATVPAATAAPSMAARVENVDLLRQINPLRDSTRGAWTFQGTDLASPRSEAGVLRLPVTPPAEYRLTVVVQRLFPLQRVRIVPVRPPVNRSRRPSRTQPPAFNPPSPPMMTPQPAEEMPPAENEEGLEMVVLLDGRPAALLLDGRQRTVSGLELIDGKPAEENATAFHGEVLVQGRAVTIICTVGPGSVDATVDGRTIVHWTGQSNHLSLEPELAADSGNGLALVASSQFRIQRIELVSLGGGTAVVAAPMVAASADTRTGPGAAGAQANVGVPPTRAGGFTAPGNAVVAVAPEVLQCVALVEHPLASGSGFAVGKKLVVTNAHVVEGAFADEIKVRLGTEGTKPQPVTRILYFDRSRDLSVVELKQSDLAGLPVRGDYRFVSGARVTLVGNPSAGGGILLRNAVNRGRFNGVVHIKQQDFYQIEASVNPGWSGGPVLDSEGKVVAIVAMKAADEAVAALRGSMGRLDQDFRTRIGYTAYNVGLTYGIPAAELWNVLNDPNFRDEDRAAEANDRHAARTLTDRLTFLAAVSALRVQISVPATVRAEALNAARGMTPSGKLATGHKRPASGEPMTFMSEFDAARLGRVLDTETVKSMESKFQDRLDERIDAIQASEFLPDAAKRELLILAGRIREAKKFVEHPPTTYVAFSTKAKGFLHDFKEHLKRLAESLKEKELEL